jgi:hypothetical protein
MERPETLRNNGSGTPVALEVRLLRRRILASNGCWEWNGTKTPRGYGNITVGSWTDGTRRVRKVHAVAYETWIGPVPDGMELDHICRNTSCFNPEHLEPVAHRVNIRRAFPMGGTFKCGHIRSEGNVRHERSTGYVRCLQCTRDQERARNARRKRKPAVA